MCVWPGGIPQGMFIAGGMAWILGHRYPVQYD